jgi:hypothetical protein
MVWASGAGKTAQLERKIGQQTSETDFLKGGPERIDEHRKLQALTGKQLSAGSSKPIGTRRKP